MSRDAVAVTGVGAVSPLGRSADAAWAALVAGRSASRTWPDLEAEGFPVARACRVDGEPADGEPRGRWLGRAAADEALRQSGLPEETRRAAGLFVGTTMGESAAFEAAAEGGGFRLDEAAGSSITRGVAEAHGLRGPGRTYGTACAAGNYAIGAAAAAVRRGRIPAALAGGVEPFSRIALLGFARMRAMAPDVCRPFDRERRGMQLGEGAAFLVLERSADARRRGARPLAEIAGFGLSGDAHHPTAPRADGSGMATAMAAALADASLPSDEVDWLCAHGTGTPSSDAAEAVAVHSVFGRRAPPVSSLKGAFGHTLGAATAVEAVMAVAALRAGVVPGGATTERVDESLGLDVVREARERPGLSRIVSCGYGFGGLNSALVIEAAT